jgi:outer membrane receptor protein involved in Fe transport
MHAPGRRRRCQLVLAVALALDVTTAGRRSRADDGAAAAPAYQTTVSAVRPPTLSEPPPYAAANVQVIDRAQIEASGAATLGELLGTLGAAELEDEQGNGVQADLVIRGVPASPVTGLSQGVNVFVDGVPVNEPTAGEVNFDLVPLADAERVVVVRGPGALAGSGALAGAVYVVTRRGTSNLVEASAGAGRFGLRQARARAAGHAGPVDGYLSAGYLTSDGFRALSAARVAQLVGKIGVGGARGDLTLSYQLQSDHIEQPGSLPASLLAIDRTANLSSGDYFQPELQQLALGGYVTLGGGLSAFGSAFFRALDATQYNVNLTDANTRLVNRTRSGGATLALAHAFTFPGLRHELRAGAEWARDDVTVTVTTDPAGDVAAALADARANLGLFAQESLRLEPSFDAGRAVVITAGVRADRLSHDIVDTTPATPGAASGQARFSRALPAFGLRFEWTPHLALAASYAEGFRAPAFLELTCADPAAPCIGLQAGVAPDAAFAPLRPVLARNYELALHAAGGTAVAGAPAGELDLALFRLDLFDDILAVSPNGLTQLFFQNVARTRRQGLELRGHARLGRFDARVSYALTFATFEDPLTLASPRTPGADEAVPAGARLPLVPLHTGTGHLTWSPIDGITLGASLRYVGPSFFRGDEANTQPMLPGYWVAGATLRAERGRFWGALRVSNLLDRRYETFGTYAARAPGAAPEPFLTPAPPIDAMVQLGCRLP